MTNRLKKDKLDKILSVSNETACIPVPEKAIDKLLGCISRSGYSTKVYVELLKRLYASYKVNENGEVYLHQSMEDVANYLKVSRQTIINATNTLSNIGLIEKVRSFQEYGKVYFAEDVFC